MKSVDPGVLSQSTCFSFTPSAIAEKLYFYIPWCGHYFCTSKYFMKRDYYFALLAVYVCQGCLHVQYRNHTYNAVKGDVVLLDCREPHYYHAADGLEFVYMHFDGSNSHEICQHLLRVRGPLIRSSNNILIYNLIYNTVKFYENGEIEHMIDTSMRVYKLIRYLHENAAYEPHNETPVEKTIHYIRDHIDKKISLRNLAEVANLSEYYFTRYFKEQTGYTPIEYATMAKLDHAKVLLIRTDMTIREIAASVGYHNSNGFTNLFKDKIGCSPQMFRKLMR